MSTTFKQHRLVTGYCRQIKWVMIETLVRLISLYFVIPECWSTNHGRHIKLGDNNEYCEHSWNQQSVAWYCQEFVHGKVIIQPWPNIKAIVRWQCEYFMLHHSSYPLFIGICGYHIGIIKNHQNIYIGYGISFGNREMNDPWVKSIQYKGVRNNLEFERDIYIKEEFDNKFIDDLAFGEVELMVIIQNSRIEVIMKIYTHPNTLSNKSTDYLRKTQFQDKISMDKFWLTATLPMRSGLKIKSFEAYGSLNVDFRESSK